MVEVSSIATGASPRLDGETVGEVTGLLHVVVEMVAVVRAAVTGEPTGGAEVVGVPP